jgi:DNA-binding protein
MIDYIKTQESTNKFNETPFLVNNEPVMITALEVLSILGNTDEISIKGKGETCPNTVAVANIITENILKGKSKTEKIIVDSDITDDGYMISTIEIIIKKIN